MVEIERNRRRAILVALDHIDRNRKEYKDKVEQDDVLEELIEDHDLQELYKPKGLFKRPELIPLTVDKYRGALGRLASTRKKDTIKKAGILDLFQKGSSLIDPTFLERIRREESSANDSEDEGDADDPEPEHREAESQRQAKGATSSEVPNSVDESSQEMEIDTDNGNVLPVQQAPPVSPMSVGNDQVADSKKRKRNDSDDSISLPILTKKKATAEQVNADLTIVRTTRFDNAPVEENLVKLEQPDPATQGVHASETPSIQDISVPQLLKISVQDVTSEVDGIWTDIQSLIHNMQSEIGGQKGHFLYSPNDDLKRLYIRILGAKWEERVTRLVLYDLMKCRTFVEAVIAAALYEMVWNCNLPWNGPKEVLKLLDQESKYMNQVLSASECPFSLETLVWQAAYVKVTDQEFKDATIRPHARSLACTFLRVVLTMLKSIWPKKPADPDSFWDRITDNLINIFIKAVALKAQTAVSPDYYRYTWIESGKKADNTAMELIQAGDGVQEVIWALTPLIEKKSSQEAEWSVVSPAKVFTRPKRSDTKMEG